MADVQLLYLSSSKSSLSQIASGDVALVDNIQPNASTAFILNDTNGDAMITISTAGDIDVTASAALSTGGALTLTAGNATSNAAGGGVTIRAGNASGIIAMPPKSWMRPNAIDYGISPIRTTTRCL